MDTGLFRLPAGAGRSLQRGYSMLELTVVVGISGLLSLAGLGGLDAAHLELDAAQQELVESLDQAFVLARARGVNITLGLASGKDPNHLPIHLGRQVKWGKPAGIPLPSGMEDPARAATQGEAHPTITVTPRRTATASLWFLNDGRDVLCMRLSNHGRIHLLRWRSSLRRWKRV